MNKTLHGLGFGMLTMGIAISQSHGFTLITFVASGHKYFSLYPVKVKTEGWKSTLKPRSITESRHASANVS